MSLNANTKLVFKLKNRMFLQLSMLENAKNITTRKTIRENQPQTSNGNKENNNKATFDNKETSTADIKNKDTTEDLISERDVIYAKKTTTLQANVTSIITATAHRNTGGTEIKIGMSYIDKEEEDTIMKKTLTTKHNTTMKAITADTTATTIEEEIQTQEDDTMTIISEKMAEMRIGDIDKKIIISNTTITTMMDILQEIQLDTAEKITEATTEIGMKETDPMTGIEWLDAINWQPYQNTNKRRGNRRRRRI
ncbi:hypothetical protein RhiirA1_401761 [Rhizophagus irregularis]|uniref:Uncharacterized protein n=2 Tax=Rhizophagus irregularis TaxID=588596 RepID=A0A2N0R0X6_9GLOM|nr:hypothetical protein RhiirA1_401761 [Rhizophagus irregularis]